ERRSDDAVLAPDELRRLVAHVRRDALDLELRRRVVDAQRPLERERGLAAARREADLAFREDIDLPRQRRHLAVERDLPPAIRTRLVHAREELLPSTGVVPHEL